VNDHRDLFVVRARETRARGEREGEGGNENGEEETSSVHGAPDQKENAICEKTAVPTLSTALASGMMRLTSTFNVT
jgi:hypothetical protein